MIEINDITFQNTPETCIWLNFGNTALRYIQLMDEIKFYVRTNITPIEKIEYLNEMTNTLLKVMLFIETKKDVLKDFNVSEFMFNASNDYNEELNKGNKIHFNDYLKKRLLTLPDVMKMIIL